MSKAVVFAGLILLASIGKAQENKFELKEGNELYQQKQFDGALDKFNQLSTDPDPAIADAANFNKGNTYYQTEDYESALAAFTKSAANATNNQEKAKAYHNLGNTHLKMQKLEESLAAFKKALILNPQDEDARYNYALVKKLLEQQLQQDQKDQQQQDQQDQQEKKEEQKQDENKDQQNQQEQNQQDQKQEQQQEEQQQEQQQQEEQQRQQKQMMRKNAENLLDALNQQEKGVQRKVNKAKGKGKKIDIEKDW